MQNKMKKVMLYFFKNILPLYALIPVVSCFVWNGIVYNGSRLINKNMKHYDMTLGFEKSIPVIPIFMIIYFGCFAIWIVYYIANVRVGKKECARFVSFDLLTRTICAVFFLLLPTYNVRPEICGNDFFSNALRFLYDIDAADNLFPSIHCLVSWNCFVGIRELDCYKKRYKVIAFVMAVLVFISTLVTKQHVVLDIISAVIVSEMCWWFVKRVKISDKIWNCFEKVNNAIFGRFVKGKRDLL